jgi:nascent polypeptide-associated complex subunit alpha
MFGGGGGGLDSRKMKQMMEQMGIDIEEIDAQEVVITTPDGKLVFTDAEVQKMGAQGQETYQVVGSPERREAGALEADADGDAGSEEHETAGDTGVPEEDIDLVAQRTGAGKDTAREALEATDGDLAAAVERLE